MDLDINELRRWYDEYAALDRNSISPDHAVIQAANSDELNESSVEERIHTLTSEIRVLQGFCAACQTILEDWPYSKHDSEPYPNSDSVWDWRHVVVRSCNTLQWEASMRNGCKLCGLIIQVLKDARALGTFRRIEARLERLHEDSMASLSVQNWGEGSSQILWLNPPGKPCTHCNCQMAMWTKFLSLGLEDEENICTSKYDVLGLAGTWLGRCNEEHDSCRSHERMTMPTRLISVADGFPKLTLTADWTTAPHYATLSHSWGKEGFIRLTQDNLKSFLSIIPDHQLPETFKDAITVTRALGIKYLWIDSLCIIQDDLKDWGREAATMKSVYGDSFINIAASTATDGTQGCFNKPEHFIDGFQTHVVVNGEQRVQQFRLAELYDSHTRDTHLATRAWALQEKLLPPRTLHLGNRGAFWECRSLLASEHFPHRFPLQLETTLVYTKQYELRWEYLVHVYSAADISFDKDKLPALSGIAQLAHGRTGHQYLAGMWRPGLEAQLCWTLREAPRTRPAQGAPTWSWASVNGGVLYSDLQSLRDQDCYQDEFAHVVEASTTPVGCDPFGEVSGGIIRLCCSAVLAGRRCDVVRSKSAERGLQAAVVRYGAQEQMFSFWIDRLEEERATENELVYFLPLIGGKTGCRRRSGKEGEWVDELTIQGLVLERTDLHRSQFQRIGCFKFYQDPLLGRDEDTACYQPFLSMLDEHGEKAVREICAQIISNSEYPNESYTLTIG